MLVRLTVKLADLVDGIDLAHCSEGDVIELAERDAELLIAEGWAERVAQEERVTCSPDWQRTARGIAADRGRKRRN